MAEHKVTIDVEARFDDGVSRPAGQAEKAIDDLEKAARDAAEELGNLGKKKTEPKVDADTSKLLKKIREAEAKAEKLGKSKTSVVLNAVDKATTVINRVTHTASAFGNKTYQALVKIRDSEALSSLRKITDMGQHIGRSTWTAIVRIKDMALSPLQALEHRLFSIKTLVAGIFAGAAFNKLIMAPISLADTTTNSLQAFRTMLGEVEGEAKYHELMDLAKATPFGAQEVVSQAQQLIGYGFDPTTIAETMTTIGDAAAALGKGNAGLSGLALVLGQIKARPTLSGQDVNQISGWGIDARGMLADYFGVTKDEIAVMQEKSQIRGDEAVQAILQGMQKRYGGMMDKMATSTFGGLMETIKDTLAIDVFSKWGEGLQSGGIKALSRISKLMDDSEEKLAEFGELLKEIGTTISNWVAAKLENSINRISKLMDTQEWKEAGIGGKIGILWNGVVVDPIKEWWENGGREKAAETAEKVGKWLGGAITSGLLAVFGATEALNGENTGGDVGAGVAKSFVSGFTENFDGEAITEAFVDAIGNVWEALPWWAKLLVGGKIASGIGGTVMNIAGGIGTAKTLLMGGSAAVEGGGVVAGLLPTAGSIIGSTGNAMVGGSGILGGLSSLGYLVTGGAEAGALAGAAGTVAAGAGAGVIGGALGIGAGALDIYKGTKQEGKEAKDSYVKGGTKIGMVGTGAAAGAAIGSVVPVVGTAAGALIGAGVGGISALLGGNKLGKKISDATDGWGEAISGFFTDTVPGFFTETIPEAAGNAKEAISGFFTETIPEKWDSLWDSVGNFFTEKVPYGIGYATGKVHTFFTETLPEKWDELWGTISNFFTETLPTWAEDTWNNKIVPFFTESIPGFFGSLWDSIKTFFTETLPTWADDTWNNEIVPFFTESVPGFFGSLWDGVKTLFSEGLPAIGEKVWGSIKGFFTDTIPEMAQSVWGKTKELFSGVGDFFSGFGSKVSEGFNASKKARGGIIYPTGVEIPGYASGGLVGGAGQLVRVAEEGTPEMIIPLGSQRRERGLSLWAKAGQMMGVGDAGLRFQQYGGTESAGGQAVNVDVGGITFEINVDGDPATGGITEAIKAQAEEIAETVAGILADAFQSQFENTPVRG